MTDDDSKHFLKYQEFGKRILFEEMSDNFEFLAHGWPNINLAIYLIGSLAGRGLIY
jgi:hypothetical protein